MGQICSAESPDQKDNQADVLDQKTHPLRDVNAEDNIPEQGTVCEPQDIEEKQRQEKDAEERRLKEEEEKRILAKQQAEAQRKFEQKQQEEKEKAEEARKKMEAEEAAERERIQLIAAEEEKKREEEIKAEAEKKEAAEAEDKKKAVEKDKKMMKDFLSTNGFKDVNGTKKNKGVLSGSFTFPLLEAAQQNNAEMVRILLENGADIKMSTKTKKTVLEKAEKFDNNGSHAKVIGFLKARQALPGGAA